MATPMSFEQIGAAEGISATEAYNVYQHAMHKIRMRSPQRVTLQGRRALRELRGQDNFDGSFRIVRARGGVRG
jgi:hypothetical protein